MGRYWHRHWHYRGSGGLGYFAYVVAIIGAIVMIIFGLAALLSFSIPLPFSVPLRGYVAAGIITLIMGIVAVVGARRVFELIWAIVLIAIGFIAGGIGGLLVLIGGLLGLLARFV